MILYMYMYRYKYIYISETRYDLRRFNSPRAFLRQAQEFLGNAWAPIASLSGVSREEIMGQARRGALPAGVLVAQGAMAAVEKFLEKGPLKK